MNFVENEITGQIEKEEKCLKISNYGKVFSDMRNEIGHGFPSPLEEKHIVVFRLSRVLIYALILSACGIGEENIKEAIRCLRM